MRTERYRLIPRSSVLQTLYFGLDQIQGRPGRVIVKLWIRLATV